MAAPSGDNEGIDMLNNHIREVAFVILRFALRIVPRGTADWGHAMLAELGQVPGSWAALGWSLGCFGVLLGMALKEIVIRKTAAIVALCSLVLVVSSFAIPTFRQAFGDALVSWRVLFETRGPGARDSELWPDRDLQRMASTAAKTNDAPALAFVATRLNDTQRASQMAEKAVALDRGLTWVYGVVAVRHPYPTTPNLDIWTEQLRQWDSSNALPYLITAEADDIQQIRDGKLSARPGQRDDIWQRAMAAAVESKTVDTYLGRQLANDRDVAKRYRLQDGLIFLRGYTTFRTPSYAFSDVATYLNVKDPFRALINARRGQDFEGNGLLEQLSTESSSPVYEPPISSATWRIRWIQASALLVLAFGLLLIVAAVDRMRHPVLPVAGSVGLLGCALLLYVSYRPFGLALHQFINDGRGTNLNLLRMFYAFLTPPFGLYRFHATQLMPYIWEGLIIVCVLALTAIVYRRIHLRRSMA